MEPVVLSLTCPKVRTAMADIAVMQRWEVLRRSSAPLTVHELAVACGVSDAVAQRSLDLLVDANLAVRLKATALRRGIAYRPVAERVLVEWDSSSEDEIRFLLEHRQALRSYSRSVIDRNDTAEVRGMPGLPKFRGHQSFTLTHSEAAAITQALRSAWEFVTRIELQARERMAAAPKHAHAADAPRQDGTPQELAYHIALEFRPLKTPELPVSDIGTWEKQTLARELAYLSSVPASVLTVREREIAKLLADGRSRPQVAKALGLSVNTIASATKRIYAKLGVRTRAEFAARMKSG